MKEYGQDLQKKLIETQKKLDNTISKIGKRFDMILEDYREYLTEADKKKIMMLGATNLSIESKLDVIINTEDNYNKLNGNQLDIFND